MTKLHLKAAATSLLLALAGTAAALPISTEFLGHVGGSCEAVALEGNLLASGEGPRLLVLDTANPAKPVLRSRIMLPDIVRGVVLRDGIAYVADATGGLQIVDLTTPDLPVIRGSIRSTQNARAIALAGNYAYVAAGSTGVVVFDVSVPSGPTQVTTINTPGFSQGVTVDGDRLAVADSLNGVVLVDIASPRLPLIKSTLNTPGDSFGVNFAGNLLLIADGPSGFQVADVTDLAAPRVVGTLDTLESANAVTRVGTLAYIGNTGAGVAVVDFATPNALVLKAVGDTEGTAQGVAVRDGFVFVADTRGVSMIDAHDLSKIDIIANYSTAPSNAVAVKVSAGRAYVADRNAETVVVDANNPSTPAVLGSFETSSTPRDIAVQGNQVHVADASAELHIVDATNPANPVLRGVHRTSYSARKLTLAGNYDYISTSGCDDLGCYEAVQIVDVSDPANPVLKSSTRTAEFVSDVAVEGNLAFLAEGWGKRLLVWDVSDPSRPVELGAVSIGDYASSVAVRSSSTVVVAAGNSGVVVADVSNPRQPAILNAVDTPDFAWSVEVKGRLGFVADGLSGVQILDLGDAAKPAIVGVYDTPSAARDMAPVGDDQLAIADGRGGLIFVRYSGELPPLEEQFETDLGVPDLAADWIEAAILFREGLTPTFERVAGSGLRINSLANYTFAFWINRVSAARRTWRQPAAGRIYVVDWDLRSSVDGLDTPGTRLRMISGDQFFSQNYIFNELAFPGDENFAVSPGTAGRAFRTITAVPAHTTNSVGPNGFNLGFDLYQFNQGVPASVTLRRIRERTLDPASLTGRTTVYQHAFVGGDTDNWTTGADNYGGRPVTYSANDGLGIKSSGAYSPLDGKLSFGFWQTRRNALGFLDATKWYRLEATITGSATRKGDNPTARFRLFAAGSEFTGDMVVGPEGASDTTPSADQDGETYVGWFAVPPGVSGDKLRLAFDLYHIVPNGLRENPELRLKAIKLESFNAP